MAEIKVKGLEWQKLDTWWAHCDVTNRDYSIFEEEGRAWAHVGNLLMDYDTVEIAKVEVDKFRADLIRSVLED